MYLFFFLSFFLYWASGWLPFFFLSFIQKFLLTSRRGRGIPPLLSVTLYVPLFSFPLYVLHPHSFKRPFFFLVLFFSPPCCLPGLGASLLEAFFFPLSGVFVFCLWGTLTDIGGIGGGGGSTGMEYGVTSFFFFLIFYIFLSFYSYSHSHSHSCVVS